jgi:dTDP-4-dehydrorhamnose reductase
MKLLVIGASGLVGWNLFQKAKDLGHEVVGTYRDHALPGLIPFRSENKSSFERLFTQVQLDGVFYCAGWSAVDGCEEDPGRAHLENAKLPGLAAEWAFQSGSHFTYFSTSYVFDGRLGPYDETADSCPISAYGRSKLAGEIAVQEATAGKALIARTMGVYGDEPQRKNFVYKVRSELGLGRHLKVPNDQFGNATYAPDLADAAIELNRRSESGIWNVAGPRPQLRRSDFASQIAQAYGLPVALIDAVGTCSLKQAAPRPVQGGLLIGKIVQAISFRPRNWVKIS